MSVIGRVRILGEHHASHHHGTVLVVTDNHADTHSGAIYRDHAEVLVERGEAEWVSDDGQHSAGVEFARRG